jgi:hypothetical protein
MLTHSWGSVQDPPTADPTGGSEGIGQRYGK